VHIRNRRQKGSAGAPYSLNFGRRGEAAETGRARSCLHLPSPAWRRRNAQARTLARHLDWARRRQARMRTFRCCRRSSCNLRPAAHWGQPVTERSPRLRQLVFELEDYSNEEAVTTGRCAMRGLLLALCRTRGAGGRCSAGDEGQRRGRQRNLTGKIPAPSPRAPPPRGLLVAGQGALPLVLVARRRTQSLVQPRPLRPGLFYRRRKGSLAVSASPYAVRVLPKRRNDPPPGSRDKSRAIVDENGLAQGP
jgi:hypothetical protein